MNISKIIQITEELMKFKQHQNSPVLDASSETNKDVLIEDAKQAIEHLKNNEGKIFMDPLMLGQLASTSVQIIGEATHSNVKHNIVEQVKIGLNQVATYCQQQHEAQGIDKK